MAPSFTPHLCSKEAVMADEPVSDAPTLSVVPNGRRWPAWRSIVDWALIGAAVGAVLWLTVTAWASLTWFIIGLVIYELLLPLINRLARDATLACRDDRGSAGARPAHRGRGLARAAADR